MNIILHRGVKTFLLYFLFSLFSAFSFAQNYSIKGNLISKNTGEPIAYASIYCKETKEGFVSDFKGYFSIKSLAKGTYQLKIKSLGYLFLDTTILVDRDKSVLFFLKEKTHSISEVLVIAKQKRSSLSTTSEIKKEALTHLQPNSIADVLELLPGGISKQQSMVSMNLIALRQPLASNRVSNQNNEFNSSLGTSFVIDDIPLSNDGQLQNVSGAAQRTGSGDNYIVLRNTTGKGIDMRTLSADDIESIEIVRGIPSVRYGELTSGLVNIKRSFKAKPLKIRAKSNPTIKLVATNKGFEVGKHSINAGIDYIDYKIDPRNTKLNYGRITSSLRFANAPKIIDKPLSINISLDYTGSFDKEKKDKQDDTKDEFYRNDYNNIRLSTSLTYKKQKSFLDNLSFNFSGSYTDEQKTIQRIAIGRTTPIITSREAGEFYGKFLPPSYLAHLRIDGKPLFLFAQANSVLNWNIKNIENKLFIGADWRYNKNFGEGEIYDVEKPLYAGNGRPRKSKDIPSMQMLSFYVEEQTSVDIKNNKLSLQMGVRGSMALDMNKKYTKLAYTPYFDPRINATWDFPKIKIAEKHLQLSMNVGFGWHTKFPTLWHLYPEQIYFDKVQLNYYSQNKNLRQMHYKTQIINPINYQLKPNRNKKWEMGFRASYGQMQLSIIAYKEVMSEGFKTLSRYQIMSYKEYDIDTGPSPSTLTQAPTVDMFQYKNMKDFLIFAQKRNGGYEEKRGIEYELDLGRIEFLKSRVSINGAWMLMKYDMTEPNYKRPTVRVGGNLYPFIGYYNWKMNEEYEQWNTNFRFDTQIEQLKMIFSSTFQFLWFTTQRYTPHNGMPEYYADLQHVRHPYKETDQKDPMLRFLYSKPSPDAFDDWKVPISIDFNLKVTKKIKDFMTLAFYVNRILYFYPDYTRKDGYEVKRTATPYFGMELHINI